MAHRTQLDDIRLIRQIATGGMAELWEGRQQGVQSFEKRLAVKMILPHLAKDQEFVKMFLDEARLAAQLNHTNICQIYKLDEYRGTYYIAMEYIEGHNTAALLRTASIHKLRLPFEIICQIILGVCAALDYAHSRTDEIGEPLHIVHRDLSPPNIMITLDGHIKVIDFGIAKASSHMHHTPPDTMRGKFSYMSPEYVFDKPIDARSDIFSVGIVLWELVTGQQLFQGDNEFAKMHKISENKYNTPSMYREETPPELEEIIMKALAFNKRDRYQTCAEMQEAVEQFLQHYQLPSSPRRLASYVKWLMDDPIRTPSPLEDLSVFASPSTPAVSPSSSDLDVAMPALGDAWHVLMIDPHRDLLETLQIIFSSQGYEVTFTQDGAEAVEWSRNKPFDVVLMDLNLPQYKGQEIIRHIKERSPSLPFVVQTAEYSLQKALELGRLGVHNYLVKPAKTKLVLQAISDAIHARPEGQELEDLICYQFPTPLAAATHTLKNIQLRPDYPQQRHAALATLFERYSYWMGALFLGMARRQTLPPNLKHLCQAHTEQKLGPAFWLQATLMLSQHYKDEGLPLFSRAVQGLYSGRSWHEPHIRRQAQAIIQHLAPILDREDILHKPATASLALYLLQLYHRGLWRDAALLSQDVLTQSAEVIQPFLCTLLQQMIRIIDFNLASVDAIETTTDGHLHHFTLLRGLVPGSISCLLESPLQLQGLYLLDQNQRPLLSLFPYMARFNEENEGSSLSTLIQFNAAGKPTYRNLKTGYLQHLSGRTLQRGQSILQSLLDTSPTTLGTSGDLASPITQPALLALTDTPTHGEKA